MRPPCLNREFLVSLSLVVALHSSLRATAQDKSGVSSQAISLPSGPGSIEGLGESFQPQLNTGVATYKVDIKVPPGVAGHNPSLSINYNGGIGNGCMGPGWTLAVPAFSRQTDEGQPNYSSADVIIDSSAEELVELTDDTFRRRNELDGLFARIERLGEGWQLHAKNGQVFVFGQYPNAQDPARRSRVVRNDDSFDETFMWLVDEIRDTSGNSIHFYYSQFPADSPGVLFLTEVRYSVNGPTYHSVQFDYVVRADRAKPGGAAPTAGLADYRAGFRQIMGRRCEAVRVYAGPQQVRKYTFSYSLSPGEDPAPPPPGAVSTNVSRLCKVTEWDSTFSNYLPPLTFSYSPFQPADGVIKTFSATPGWDIFSPVSSHTGIELFDINCDGLPDLLDGTSIGNWQYVLNQGDDTFSTPPQLMLDSPSHNLASASSQIIDLNSDARADFVNKSGASAYVYKHYEGNGQWTPQQAFVNPPSYTLGDPEIALLDLDFDKDMDVLYFHSGGQAVWFQENGSWTNALNRAWTDPALGGVGPTEIPSTLRLSDSNLRWADMNGDRLLDLVRLNKIGLFLQVRYWPNMGNGAFDARVDMAEPLYQFTGTDRLRLLDVNGDGLADLVYQATTQIQLWLNMGDGTWSAQLAIDSPRFETGNTGIRLADMNADGSIDILYNHQSGGEPRYQYLDLAPNGLPHQLIAIDNGIGSRTHIEYGSVAEFMLDARQSNRPWDLVVPLGMQVVKRYFVEFGLDLDGVPGNDQYITDIVYRDAYYDPLEKQFRGFGFVQKLERGDEFFGNPEISGPGQLSRIAFHTGAPDGLDNDSDGLTDEYDEKNGREEEPLKGVTLWTEISGIGPTGTEEWPYLGPDGFADAADFLPDVDVYSRRLTLHKIKRIHAASGPAAFPENPPIDPDYEVRFPFVEEARTHIVELEVEQPRELRTTYEYDGYGNIMTEVAYGTVGANAIPDDERKTSFEYTTDTVNWILDRPTHILVTDENDAWVKESMNWFDARGLLEKEQHRIAEGDRFIDIATNTYYPNGNLESITNARGFTRTVTYDPQFNAFPDSESIEVGAGNPNLFTSAQYDARWGLVTQSTDYNGNVVSFQYDSFGRLVAVIAPGDSPEKPTKQYDYRAGDVIRGWQYDYGAAGNLTLTMGAPGSTINRVRTLLRETFNSPGVIESFAYTDGLGRTLTTWQEHESGHAVVEAHLYNARGAARRTFVPYIPSPGFIADDSKPHSDFIYDPSGRPLITRLPPDNEVNGIRHEERFEYLPLKTIGYDSEDTTVGSPHFNTPKTLFYDGLGRLVQLKEMNAIGAPEAIGDYISNYEYDLQDNLITIIDPQNNTKRMEYDGLARKTKTLDPDCGTFQYFYDDTSNVVETIDALSRHIQYTYDGSNRLLTEDYGIDGVDVCYHYDLPSSDYPSMRNLSGRLSYVDDLSGAEFRSYDARGNTERVAKRIRRQNESLEDYTTIMRYDSLDRVYELVYPDGQRLSYKYNERGLLKSIPGIVDSITYRPSGQRATCSLANDVATMYQYDPRTRLRNINTLSQSAGIIQDLTYTFDGATNIIGITDGRPGIPANDPRSMTHSYVIDDLYRLTQSTGTGYGTIDYDYDKIGNMIGKTSPDIADPVVNLGGMVRGGAAGPTDRGPRQLGEPPGPHAVTAAANGHTVFYDAVGNMVVNKDKVYSWDHHNRLTTVENTEGDVLHSVFDHSDRRVVKYVDGQPDKEVVYIGSHSEIRQGQFIKFVFADGQRVARIEGSLPPPETNTTQQMVLEPGWNNVPLNVVPFSTEVSMVLASLDGAYDHVAHLTSGGFLIYEPGGGGNTLTDLEPGKAYWIHVTRKCTLEISGAPHHPPSAMLTSGWNQISIPGLCSHDIATLVAMNSSILAVWEHDALYAWSAYMSGQPAWLQSKLTATGGQAAVVKTATGTNFAPQVLPRRILFYHPDHLGSANIVTDELGLIVEETYLYPFGAERFRYLPSGDVYQSEYTFTSKELDYESGLVYFETRYYDPLLAAFICADSLVGHSPSYDGLSRSQFFNVYSYCANLPVVCTDPNGQVFGIDDLIAGAIIGAIVSAVAYTANAVFFGGEFSFGGLLRSIAIGAVSGAVTAGITGGLGITPPGGGLTEALAQAGLNTVGANAVVGAVSNYLITGVTTGEFSFRSFAIGAIQGAVGAAVGPYVKATISSPEAGNSPTVKPASSEPTGAASTASMSGKGFGLEVTLNQSTGEIAGFDPEGNVVFRESKYSYSGSREGNGLNNPAMEKVKGVGPIPKGTYEIGAAYKGPTANSFRLTPTEGTNTFGRSGFLIHGDKIGGPAFSASQGCVIIPKNIRAVIDAYQTLGGARLRVY